MKKYEVEFVSITRETYVAEIEVPDHVADDDLRSYLRGEVENAQTIRAKVIDIIDEEPVTTILTHYEPLS